ncbi:MAG: L-serine ammonia-lyase, iron-sulfur-dependent subunit beta [Bacteroidota bacterium]
MPERSSIFDMIGPIMIGPSSSHTGGVVRIGRVARRLLDEEIQHAEITFYNSFSRTYEGHGSDRAILAGLMNWAPDDERIRQAKAEAEEIGMTYHFKAIHNATHLHPNTILIHAKGHTHQTKVMGVSRGGGLILIREIEGFHCLITGQAPTLIITAADQEGSVGFLSSVIAHEQINIGTMTVNRSGKRQKAKLVFELDAEIRPLTLEYMKSLHWVQRIQYLPKLVE